MDGQSDMICPDVQAAQPTIGAPKESPEQILARSLPIRPLSVPAFQYLRAIQPRIFYGRPAHADKIDVGFVETRVGGVAELCSGVLIGKGKFLTAAHCVADNVANMKVGFGPIEASNATLPVLSATPKPTYKRSHSGNDLAILGIDTSTLCSAYKPYTVVKADNLMILTPGQLTVVGYGLNERNIHGMRLEADIPVASLTCFQQWARVLGCKTYEEIVLSSALVSESGIVRGTDTCNGDSGGPAFVYSPPTAAGGLNTPKLAALTSQGIALGGASNCGSGGIYEVVGTIDNLRWLEVLIPDLTVE